MKQLLALLFITSLVSCTIEDGYEMNDYPDYPSHYRHHHRHHHYRDNDHYYPREKATIIIPENRSYQAELGYQAN